MLVFALNGSASLPAAEAVERKIAADLPPVTADAAALADGKTLYQGYCSRCHGDNVVSGNVLPDLRYSSADVHANWQAIVHDGQLQAHGMMGFKQWLDAAQIDRIQQYVLSRAHAAKE